MRLTCSLFALALLAFGPGCRTAAEAEPPVTDELVRVEAPRGDRTDGLVRFVVIGDMGKGNPTQFAVGQGIGAACEALGGCDFALSVGDNLYPSGAESVEDPIFQERFEKPYAHLEFPFFMALGNHDYGNKGRGTDFDRGAVQVAYSAHSPRWRMPAPWYALDAEVASFFVFDTNSVYLTEFSSAVTSGLANLGRSSARAERQQQGLAEWKEGPLNGWRIAVGHHPYLSNGRHGNAGAYDGLGVLRLPGRGASIKAFVEEEICGQFDVYLAGHDHNLQDLGNVCGTEFLVSGAAGATTPLKGDNPVEFQTDQAGFLLVEADEARLTFRFFDAEAREFHSRTISREVPGVEPETTAGAGTDPAQAGSTSTSDTGSD